MTCKTTDACRWRMVPTWLSAAPDTTPVLRRSQDGSTDSSPILCLEVILLRAMPCTRTIRAFASRPPKERSSAPQYIWRGVLPCSA
jgi:hypothetical protein